MRRRILQLVKVFRWHRELRMMISTQLDVLEQNSIFALGGLTTQEEAFLVTLLNERKTAGPVIEFGTLFGITSKLLAENAVEDTVLSVDNFSWNPFGLPSELHREFTRRILRGSGVTVIDASSTVFRSQYSGFAPSFVFLDADHSYEAVRDEIAWAKDIGVGMICGHDYGNSAFGVTRAVDEMFPAGVRTCGMVWCGIPPAV